MMMAPRTLVQQKRLSEFAVSESVDVHCHCLPGMDDGPATVTAAIALCRALVADGITTVFATPHQLGRYDGVNAAGRIREAVASFSVTLLEHGVPLTVLAGADVRLDERLVCLIGSGQVLTLGDSHRYVLLELPHEVYVNPLRMLIELKDLGIRAILTHPERHFHVQREASCVLPWLEQGAVLQLTAGSLAGDFGLPAQKTAWDLLKAGWAALVATDAHNVDLRPPRMSAAIAAITSRMGPDLARQVCGDNPLRVLQGRDVLAPIDALISAR